MPDSGITTYLPGCYRNLRPKRDESLPGFLLRLAEQNGYKGISELLASTLTALKGKSLHPWLTEIRQSRILLTRLGRIACGDPDSLIHFHAVQLSSGTWFLQGCRVSAHGLNGGRLVICPECLAGDGYLREEWELAPVTVCPTHRRQLVAACPQCGHELTWRRSSINHCGNCGALLTMEHSRQAPAVSDAESRLADNFSALADFRVELDCGEVAIISWGEMLNIAQALSQSALSWLRRELRPLHDFSRLTIAERSTVLGQIASCRNEKGIYVLPLLRPLIQEKIAAISAFSPEDYLTETAFAFLMNCEELSSNIARVLAGTPESLVPIDGAAMFSKRPPSLSRPEEVANFLGINFDAYRFLRRYNYIPFHDAEEDLGLDIDVLLKAKHYLEHRLAGLDEISKMVGLPVKWEELSLFPLRLSWPAKLGGKNRVPFDDLRALQATLLEKIGGLTPPKSPVRLGDMVSQEKWPLSALSSLIAKLLDGGIEHCRWSASYRWVDIEIDADEWKQ